ncbi:MAG: RNA polymerase sigma factor [Ignavibacteriae bacterium]|nr:RNA polymerase sigma factor [Ignavibacteriota bacterium]
MTDNELMFKVRDGEVGKLGTLFERYHEKLYGFFVRHTGKKEISEDLVQEVFFRVLKYRHTFRGEAPFTVWMYQLARNASADYFRKWKNESPMTEYTEEQQSDDLLPHEQVQEQEEHRLLKLALLKLSDEKREVLVMSRFQELKYEEIGKILDCPVGTVKARVHYALRDLRDEYMKLVGAEV